MTLHQKLSNPSLKKIINIWWACLSLAEMTALRNKHIPTTFVWDDPISNGREVPLWSLNDIEIMFSLKLDIFEKEFVKN